MTRLYNGKAFSPGIGIGPASVLPELIMESPANFIEVEEIEGELQAFHDALDAAIEVTGRIRQRTGDQLFEQLSDLFSAQEKMLQDPLFVDKVDELIKDDQLCAESAVISALEEIQTTFRDRVADDVLQGRMIDIVDVGWRVLRQLDTSQITPGLPHGGVLVARDLAPSMAIRLDETDVDALVTMNTDQSSHTAVVSQALEIPAIGIQEDEFFDRIDPGETVIVAANQNRVLVDPTEEELEDYAEAQNQFYQFTHSIRDEAGKIDDEELPCAIRGNIGIKSEIPFLQRQGGHGSGLVRTELLYMKGENQYPSYETQVGDYKQIARSLDPYTATIRTFDVGGDKEAFQSAPEEPSVKGRGVQRSLHEEERFVDQLSALVEAYQGNDNIKIMIPMVGGPGEIRDVKSLLRSIADERDTEVPPLGIMVEIPSSVFLLPEIVEVVDFLSIGTNDLMYYLMGADRFEEGVLNTVELPDPALFRCVKQIIEVARSGNCPVSVCGELAGNPVFTPVFVGLGISELSMSPIRIPEVKLVARSIDKERAVEFADDALDRDERDRLNQLVEDQLGPRVQEILHQDEMAPKSRKYNF